MAVGQGAGTVAHFCVKEKKSPLEIDIKNIRAKLEEKGAFLTVPKNYYMFSEEFGKDEVLEDPNKLIFSKD